jgi:hypothetical protein
MPIELLEQGLWMRGLERLLVVAGGITAIVVGALLYRWGVGGQASLSVEHDRLKMQLLNASPGLFFGLFGSAILIWSLVSPLRYTSPADGSGAPATETGPQVVYGARADALQRLAEAAADADPTLDAPLLRRQLQELKDRARDLLRQQAAKD